MSSTEDVYRTIERAEQHMQVSAQRLERMQRLPELTEGLTGSAESEDGFVRVEADGTGVTDLVIDPKAMRMAAEDLATTIRNLIGAASVDYREQLLAAMREADVLPDEQDQDERLRDAMAKLDAAQQEFGVTMRAAAGRIDEATRLAQQSQRAR